jgi:glycine cleavage system H protein
MRFPEELLYHPSHTWARIDGETATVGITDHAQKELGDVVFLELPSVGRKLKAGEVFGSVESSKSVSELVSPLRGEVTEANSGLEDRPELINEDPYGEGWMIRVRVSPEADRTALLDATAYRDRLPGG